MRTLVTHNNPHLDDLCGMWLLARYAPDFVDADFRYISSDLPKEQAQDSEDVIHIGVGRGKFDEHKGDHGECATTLVAQHVFANTKIDALERKALDKLVAWVLAEDTGTLLAEPRREFSVPMILQSAFFSEHRDNEAVRRMGFAVLDAVMVGLRDRAELDLEWEHRIEFPSRFGKAVALRTDAKEFPPYAYGRGFDLVALTGKDKPYVTIRAAAGTDIDLTPVRDRIAETDKDARWFFHHSKKMLICGGEKSAEPCTSRLTLEDLIEMLT